MAYLARISCLEVETAWPTQVAANGLSRPSSACVAPSLFLGSKKWQYCAILTFIGVFADCRCRLPWAHVGPLGLHCGKAGS